MEFIVTGFLTEYREISYEAEGPEEAVQAFEAANPGFEVEDVDPRGGEDSLTVVGKCEACGGALFEEGAWGGRCLPWRSDSEGIMWHVECPTHKEGS